MRRMLMALLVGCFFGADQVHSEMVDKNKRDEKEMGGGGTRSVPSTPNGQLAKAFSIKDLAHLPIDSLLLHWVRMNLQASAAVKKPADRVIKNLTSDLCDGRRFLFLLNLLFPSWFKGAMVYEIDSDERLKNVATFHTMIQPELPQVVTCDSIHAGGATENLAFIAMLFGASL